MITPKKLKVLEALVRESQSLGKDWKEEILLCDDLEVFLRQNPKFKRIRELEEEIYLIIFGKPESYPEKCYPGNGVFGVDMVLKELTSQFKKGKFDIKKLNVLVDELKDYNPLVIDEKYIKRDCDYRYFNTMELAAKGKLSEEQEMLVEKHIKYCKNCFDTYRTNKFLSGNYTPDELFYLLKGNKELRDRYDENDSWGESKMPEEKMKILKMAFAFIKDPRDKFEKHFIDFIGFVLRNYINEKLSTKRKRLEAKMNARGMKIIK